MKQRINNEYYVYNNGREVTNIKLTDWLITIEIWSGNTSYNIDTDGTMKDLIDYQNIENIKLPLIYQEVL